jgi:FtsH-binding integral membrane protein
MKKELIQHRGAYLVLVTGLAIFIFAFLGLWPNHFAQQVSVVVMAIFYLLWGVVTHVKTQSISSRVVAEYAGVSFLAAALLLFITL